MQKGMVNIRLKNILEVVSHFRRIGRQPRRKMSAFPIAFDISNFEQSCFNCYVEKQRLTLKPSGKQAQVRSFAKFSNKDKKKRKDQGGGEASRNSFHIKLLDSPPGLGSKAFSEAEQEEFKAIGAEYNRMSMKTHRAEMKDLNMKLKLKREAIDMLPTTSLQEEAMIIDTNDGPTRRIPTWTPPIPNFDPAKYNVND